MSTQALKQKGVPERTVLRSFQEGGTAKPQTGVGISRKKMFVKTPSQDGVLV